MISQSILSDNQDPVRTGFLCRGNPAERIPRPLQKFRRLSGGIVKSGRLGETEIRTLRPGENLNGEFIRIESFVIEENVERKFAFRPRRNFRSGQIDRELEGTSINIFLTEIPIVSV